MPDPSLKSPPADTARLDMVQGKGGDDFIADRDSPYLALHANGPVNWHAWTDETLAQARTARKPVLLSTGFAACHWCSAMAREAFADPATATFINDAFLPVLVDRDQRPDIDYLYQYAIGLLGQRGGWPLTMILDHDGRPFWGGVYFPTQAQFGLPSLGDALRSAWKAFGREAIREGNLDVLGGGLADLAPSGFRYSPPGKIVADARISLLEQVDWQHGGFGYIPKFPEVPALSLLWEGWRQDGDARARKAVLLALDHICQGGLYDHIGGGFARYAVDEGWRVPHFEKLIGDNAQLIELLTRVWLDEREPLYAERISQTIDWLEREMRLPCGAFAQSLSAEAGGQEGSFYVWDAAEIEAVLGEEADHFCRVYAVKAEGNWHGRAILNRLDQAGFGAALGDAERAAACARLLQAREKRIRPERDERTFVDTNGMLIAALAGAGQAFERSDWIDLAAAAFAFITGTACSTDSRLQHVSSATKPAASDFLDDYAQMARAALALHDATGSEACLQWASSWAEVGERWFFDQQGGGYFLSPHDGPSLIVRAKNMRDTHVPSGNAAMIEVLCRLYDITMEPAYLETARRSAACLSSEVSRGVHGLESLLAAAEALSVLCGDGPPL